jgi:hypothetical protein
MANFTDPTQQLAEGKEAAGLPAEFQGQLNQAMLRQALAQAMLQRGLQMPEGQTIQTGGGAPNRYVPPSAFQYLASLANVAGGASGLGKSQADITGVMQQFQNAQQDETKGIQANALSHWAPAGQPVSDPAQLPDNMKAGYFAELAQRSAQSRFPEIRANAIKYAQIGAELGKEQMGQAGQTGRQLQGAVLAGSSPQSINATAAGTPFGQPAPVGTAAGLQPNNPNPQVVGGHVVTTEPQTGAAAVGPFTQGSVLAQRQQEQQRAGLEQTGNGLLEEKGAIIHSGNSAEKAKAILDLISDKDTVQGVPHALTISEGEKWLAFLGGTQIPQGVTNLDLLRNLTTSMVGDAAAGATGGKGGAVRSVKEWQAIADTVNTRGTISPDAARTESLNAIRQYNSQRGSYDRRTQAFLPRARKYGINEGFEGQLDIKPEDIAHVGSGLPAGTLDLRGLIPRPQ